MPDQSVGDSLHVQIGLLDELRVGFGFRFTDSLSLTDAISLLNAGSLGFSDSVALVDAFGLVGGGFLTLNDLLSLADLLGVGPGYVIGDNISFLDNVVISVGNIISTTNRIPFHLLSKGMRGPI